MTYSDGVSTKAYAFNNAFFEMAQNLFVDDTKVLISDGHPGMEKNDDMIVLLDVRTTQDPANLGTNRSREETLELDVMVSSYRAGYANGDNEVKRRVYEMLGLLENSCRTTDTTLGGVVRECFLTSSRTTGSTDNDVLAAGRMVDCIATFTAHARISN